MNTKPLDDLIATWQDRYNGLKASIDAFQPDGITFAHTHDERCGILHRMATLQLVIAEAKSVSLLSHTQPTLCDICGEEA